MAPQSTWDATHQGSTTRESPAPTPKLALPKGGGAIRGIGEKFSANPATGTGSLNIPIHASPGRSGFGPQLSLSYDSGAGNGAFGFGWSLSSPSITRKTDKGLPQYDDGTDSDVFVLSGTEDLVPELQGKPDGSWALHEDLDRDGYRVRYYRPRIEGLFARIERWTNNESGDVHWRSISKDNVLTVYGRDEKSQIADPDNSHHIFSWLICESYDDKGNAIVYGYRPESDQGINESKANERNRSRKANRYLKSIRYGNRKPLLLNAALPSFRTSHLDAPDFDKADGLDDTTDVDTRPKWMFEVVFDYGEGHYTPVPPDENGREYATAQMVAPTDAEWPVRQDPFSTYRAGFEVRAYRLCRRILMFHHFKDELGADDYLVRSTEFTYLESPIGSFITSVTQSGFVRDGGKYLRKSLPPVQFKYSQAQIDHTVREIDTKSLENLPVGVDGSSYQWFDLDGEGISGIFADQGNAWLYKGRLSPPDGGGENGSDDPVRTMPRFAPLELVAKRPNANVGAGASQFMDVAGDGQLDVVQFGGPTAGFYKRTPDKDWEEFKNFRALPSIRWNDPNLRFVDLTGDGHADILITEEDVFTWYPSLATEGFGEAERVFKSLNEETGPQLVFADGTQSVYLADFSGDGLSDIARIRNGEVCYWPNLGYGKFGAKVTMDNSPWLDAPDLFDQKRIRLADIDGSGTTDIIYLGAKGVAIYRNECGNSWSDPEYLQSFPAIDDLSSVVATDLRGNGTACLVWSSSLPGDARQPMRYIDLMGGGKPHLLIKSINNLGAETHVHYAASTKFYLKDKAAGRPWVTRLPFPVHVVERVETYDWISRNYFVTCYAYHHGFFDGFEREFRGFGMVDQWDTEEFSVLKPGEQFTEPTNLDAASHVPPVHTKTWFHTGAWVNEETISQHMTHEYFGAPSEADDDKQRTEFENTLLPDTVPPDSILLLPDTMPPGSVLPPRGQRLQYSFSGDEQREAVRALKGSILRQEIYADDCSDKQDLPYSVSERNYTIECLQPQESNPHAIFFVHPRETIDYHYERNPTDPRVSHALTLEVDAFGNVLRSVAAGYPRRILSDHPEQNETHVTLTLNRFANVGDQPDWYRAGLPVETRTYEMVKPPDASPCFSFDALRSLVEVLVPLDKYEPPKEKTIPYEQWDSQAEPGGPTNTRLRLIEHVRTLYRKDDLIGAWELGKTGSLALVYETYKLAFTASLLDAVYQRKRADGTDENLLPDRANVLWGPNGDQGGYVDLDGDGHWWIPSGHTFFASDPGAKAYEELDEASIHFFLPRRFEDPFGKNTFVDYAHDLLVVGTEDALQNKVAAENDYRVLQPKLVTDPNGNRSKVAFDALGLVVATAVMGKEKEPDGRDKGDKLVDDFNTDPPQKDIDDFISAVDPHAPAATLLGDATTRIVYDLGCYQANGQPVFAATLARETHVSDLQHGHETQIQISFSYSDGFGREIQKKIQAESGKVEVVDDDGKITLVDTTPHVRWVGSGWTIFNNKGKPTRQYEPFFSTDHSFQFGKKVGVSPVLFYDPLDRVVATLHPNHTYEKVVFDPWKQATWDVNDTVAFDPSGDIDVKGFFLTADSKERLPKADYLATWYASRKDGQLGDHEKDAALKAAAHTSTPSVAHFDALGRTFLTVADNGLDEKGKPQLYNTRVGLDIEGNQREVVDALDRLVMRYDYDMLRNRIHQASMEAGARWMLNDCNGKSIRSWDSRGHNFRTEYDALRRPTGLFVLGTDKANSDPRTIVADPAGILYEQIVYGEGQPPALNLRTRIFQHADAAGVVTNKAANPDTGEEEGFDFKGNLLRSSRGFFDDYKALPNLTAPPPTPDVFTSSTQYDALNRPVALTTPDGSVTLPTFNEANLLESVNVNVRGAGSAPFVTNIDYNAKGQRKLIEYGNGATTQYTYDPLTFRLTNLLTTRPLGLNGIGRQLFANADTVQDLSYTHDPAGNITQITDVAQKTTTYNGQKVDPVCRYTYDAIYRLVEVTGREHVTQSGFLFDLPDGNYRDYPFVGARDQNDLQALRNYTESYKYDGIGNFLGITHAPTGGSNWTRTYAYNEDSLIEAGVKSNQLSGTTIGAGGPNPVVESYTHDGHGNMTSMPHLPLMQWDFLDRLSATSRQVVNDAPHPPKVPEITYYVYDAAGQRVRKVNETQGGTRKNERLYLGSFEVYREYGNGKVKMERESLHVMDDKQRVALVEGQTIDNGNAVPNPTSAKRYQFSDHLGSACLELDGNANLITYEEYAPYGSPAFQAGRSGAEVSLKRYRYTGKERDEESGLYYHRVRYYVPWLGRWASCDPVGFVDGMNVYLYSRGNPIRWTDPTGEGALDWLLAPLTQPLPPGAPKQLYAGQKLIYDSAEPAAKFTTGVAKGITVATGIAATCLFAEPVCAALGYIAIGGALTSGTPTINAIDTQLSACVPGNPKSDPEVCGETAGGLAVSAYVGAARPLMSGASSEGMSAAGQAPGELSPTVEPTEPVPKEADYYATDTGEAVPTKTPSGINIQPHVAERMAAPPPGSGRRPVGVEEVDAIVQRGQVKKVEIDIQGKNAPPGLVDPNDPSTWRTSVTLEVPDMKPKPSVAINPDTNSLITVIVPENTPVIRPKQP